MRYGFAVTAMLVVLGATTTASAQCTLPNTFSNGQVADANQVMGNFNALVTCQNNALPAGNANAIQLNSGNSTFSAVGPLTNGQLLIGSTGNAPQAAALTAGSGIAIQSSAGSVTISATGGGGGSGGVDWLNVAAIVKPVASSFALRTSTTPPTGGALVSTARGIALTTTASASNRAIMAEVSAPSGNWQATMLTVYTGPLASYNLPSIGVRDSVNNRTVMFGIGGNGSGYRFDYQTFSGGIGLDTYSNDTSITDAGLPSPSSAPIWSRLTYDGTNFIWSYSRDGENFVNVFSVSAIAYVTNRSTVGPVMTFQQTSYTAWASAYHILSWSVQSL
ncbi:hypothetical protein GOZ89_24910 [Agrobacterium vitis]|uniref:hypothetical protein n=1 Tax=Agrobacterium vitis TaxID=373 RepID=UPI0012E7F143|nr:hypothetical protein [Agrobacterium vitis]MVA82645.1 hypothetical protein [Agrobacterium vitis]